MIIPDQTPKIITEEVKIEKYEGGILMRGATIIEGTALGRSELGSAANAHFEVAICNGPTAGVAVLIGGQFFIFSFAELLAVALLQCPDLEGDEAHIIIRD